MKRRERLSGQPVGISLLHNLRRSISQAEAFSLSLIKAPSPTTPPCAAGRALCVAAVGTSSRVTAPGPLNAAQVPEMALSGVMRVTLQAG
jgi:hypothetical protein